MHRNKKYYPRKKLLSVVVSNLLAVGVVSDIYAETFTPVTPVDFILNLNTANANGEADVFELNGQTFTFAGSNNSTQGPNALPTIKSVITIQNGTIERSDATANNFRLLMVEQFGNLTLSEVTLRNGQTDLKDNVNSTAEGSGGAVLNEGTLTINNSTISGNTASYYGGGLFNRNNGTATLTNSTVSNNNAYKGGGFSNSSSSNITLMASTVSGNTAQSSNDGYGGGIQNNGNLTLTNSTVSGNSADGGGGGIINYGSATINNSTISNNQAPSVGGVYNANLVNTTLSMTNTIIANSVSGDDCVNDATIATNANNLIERDSTQRPCAAPLNGDPRLGPLQNNGGPTLTHGLLAGSPAIDAGTNCSGPPVNGIDQRGAARDANCDIGAFEGESTTGPTAEIFADDFEN